MQFLKELRQHCVCMIEGRYLALGTDEYRGVHLLELYSLVTLSVNWGI
jgi:hypothetical protein